MLVPHRHLLRESCSGKAVLGRCHRGKQKQAATRRRHFLCLSWWPSRHGEAILLPFFYSGLTRLLRREDVDHDFYVKAFHTTSFSYLCVCFAYHSSAGTNLGSSFHISKETLEHNAVKYLFYFFQITVNSYIGKDCV